MYQLYMVDISTINSSYWTYFKQLIANELGTTLQIPVIIRPSRGKTPCTASATWSTPGSPVVSWMRLASENGGSTTTDDGDIVGISATILLGYNGIQWDMVGYTGILDEWIHIIMFGLQHSSTPIHYAKISVTPNGYGP